MRIGIDLGGTKIAGIALGGDGTVLAEVRTVTPRDDYAAIIAAIVRVVEELERKVGARGTVGVGIPGAVSPLTGLVKTANTTALIGHAFDRDLAAALGRPVRIANDANCFALSEAADGAAAGYDTVFGIILGTGCGGGIVVGNRVLTGRNAITGEWGHNPLPWPRDDERPGPPCYCGKRGCIEQFVSGTGLARDYGEATGRTLRSEEISALAQAGDAEACAAMDRLEERLARALASVIDILDPDAIVVGGGLSKIGRIYRNVPAQWERWIFSGQATTPLLPPKHGDASGVRGAAWLWRPEEAAQLFPDK
ncbi:MAG TPA: ROK family protein [Alphaproteobacteria bacterium]